MVRAKRIRGQYGARGDSFAGIRLVLGWINRMCLRNLRRPALGILSEAIRRVLTAHIVAAICAKHNDV